MSGNGRIRGFESSRLPGPLNFDHDLRNEELKPTAALFKAFRDFVTSDAKYKTTAAVVDKYRDFVEVELRFNLVTAAYGRVTGDRVFVVGADPEVARAVDVLPKARDLAMSAAGRQ